MLTIEISIKCAYFFNVSIFNLFSRECFNNDDEEYDDHLKSIYII